MGLKLKMFIIILTDLAAGVNFAVFCDDFWTIYSCKQEKLLKTKKNIIKIEEDKVVSEFTILAQKGA